MILIFVTITLLGMCFFVLRMIYGWSEDIKFNKSGAVVFAIAFVICVGISFFETEKSENELLLDIANTLNADVSEIIVEELEETAFLSASKNADLRRVYYKQNTYLIEVANFKVDKLVQE